jgi:hypothetical protein
VYSAHSMAFVLFGVCMRRQGGMPLRFGHDAPPVRCVVASPGRRRHIDVRGALSPAGTTSHWPFILVHEDVRSGRGGARSDRDIQDLG